MSHGPFVIVEMQRRDGQPIRAVSYLEPEADWNSGFALFRSEPEQVGDTELVCFDCLLDDELGIGKGLELAREHGEVIRVGDSWTPLICAAPRSAGSPSAGREGRAVPLNPRLRRERELQPDIGTTGLQLRQG